MTKELRISWLIFLIAWISWIPSAPIAKSSGNYRYVTEAEVVFCHETQTQTRVYQTQNKLTSLLNYLRLVRPIPGRKLTEPESQHRYRISLWFSDGSKSVYKLYGYGLLSGNDGPWQAVLPARAQLIYPLFYYLSSDN